MKDERFIKLPDNQALFFKDYFCLTQRDFPPKFYIPSYFKEIICGNTDVLKVSFSAIVFGSVNRKIGYFGHNRITAQIISLESKIAELEYYELAENLSFVLWCYDFANKRIAEIEAERQTNILLNELSITVS